MATREEIKAANAEGARVLAENPSARSAKYEPHLRRIIVKLSSGLEFLINPQSTQGLRGASEGDLKKIEITGSGLGLYFPKLDADIYIPALLEGHLGSKKWAAAELGRAGGKTKSRVKAMAARANGALGGRPRKLR